jgi:hypothetical protein
VLHVRFCPHARRPGVHGKPPSGGAHSEPRSPWPGLKIELLEVVLIVEVADMFEDWPVSAAPVDCVPDARVMPPLETLLVLVEAVSVTKLGLTEAPEVVWARVVAMAPEVVLDDVGPPSVWGPTRSTVALPPQDDMAKLKTSDAGLASNEAPATRVMQLLRGNTPAMELRTT